MTKAEAHLLLNAAKSGADISTARIMAALVATGDIRAGSDAALQPVRIWRPVGTWELPIRRLAA